MNRQTNIVLKAGMQILTAVCLESVDAIKNERDCFFDFQSLS